MKSSPNKVYAPKIAKLMLELAMEIKKETKAESVRVDASFLLLGEKGDLKLNSFISPDGKTERLLDGNVPMPRGTKLSHDAYDVLKRVAKKAKGE